VFYHVLGLVASFPVRLIGSCCCNLPPVFCSDFLCAKGPSACFGFWQSSLQLGLEFAWPGFDFLIAGFSCSPVVRSAGTPFFSAPFSFGPAAAVSADLLPGEFFICRSSIRARFCLSQTLPPGLWPFRFVAWLLVLDFRLFDGCLSRWKLVLS
jgi:hypothetical protein